MKRFRLLLTVLFLSALHLSAAPFTVDYYGVVSQSSDTNILKMAQDIFLTQLKSIEQLQVDDKRPDTARTLRSAPVPPESSHVVFYAEINEVAASSAAVEWKCTFNAIGTDGKTYTKTEQYDSYYKILVGAKPAIEDVLSQLPQNNSPAIMPAMQNTAQTAFKAESLAGTWGGEPYTDKIVLLKGGRGFVIFKNGATMNILLKVLNTDSNGNISHISVAQVGKPNASFFPSLPRETALASAATAKPITWDFQVSADGSLRGTKNTLVPSADSPTGATEGTENTVWTKK
ncbi:MAG: hypothetical protein IJS09_01675 [Treponema sp.]|nr:hypothetical protein [Treponema sp.]